MSADLEGEGKTSIKDFDEIPGSTTYIEPNMIKDAFKMIIAVSKAAIKLVEDQQCMVGSTILEAAHTLVKMIWDNYGKHPFYQS